MPSVPLTERVSLVGHSTSTGPAETADDIVGLESVHAPAASTAIATALMLRDLEKDIPDSQVSC
jgi:ApbE superfamily uncharacterized protein (UPF0280 family)